MALWLPETEQIMHKIPIAQKVSMERVSRMARMANVARMARMALMALMAFATLLGPPALCAAAGDASGGHGYRSGGYGYIIENGQAIIVSYDGPGGDVAVPGSLGGRPVSGIGPTASNEGGRGFSEASSPVTSVTLPSGLTSIGNGAFANCAALASVAVPGGVTFIGDDAFYGCAGLSSIAIPDGVKHIGAGAFSRCSSLASVAIPKSVVEIGDGAFLGCESLESASVLGICVGSGMFYACPSLGSVSLGDDIIVIGSGAFAYCTALASITIPRSVAKIGSAAFTGSGLASVVFSSPHTEFDGSYDARLRRDQKGATFSSCEELATVYAITGSQAHRYALARGLDFVPIVRVRIDGRDLRFDVPAQIIGDRTLVPMRAIFEELGAAVEWDGETQTVAAGLAGKSITMRIGDPQIEVDGQAVLLDVPPQIVNDRTLVPVRAVSESLGSSVEWDEGAQTVYIYSQR